jgi:hypothetical protein
MKSFKIDARGLKAASITTAKNDIRYYLNGMLIGDGKLVSTDGHRMTIITPKSKSDLDSMKPEIFKILGSVPASAIEAEFVYLNDNSGVILFTNRLMSKLNKVIRFEVIDGIFPKYKRVIPTGEPKSMSQIGLNLDYVADVKKIGSALESQLNAGVFEYYDDSKVCVGLISPEFDAKHIIMMVRI